MAPKFLLYSQTQTQEEIDSLMLDEDISPGERVTLILEHGQPLQKVHVNLILISQIYTTIREWLQLSSKNECLEAFEVLLMLI